MGAYVDAMKRLSQTVARTFSVDKQPKMAMRIVTKIERVQPYLAGVDPAGELRWEGREMPRWQMEMFRIAKDWEDWFYTQWGELWHHENSGRDFLPDDSQLSYKMAAKTKEAIESRKRMYSKNKYWNRVRGD